MSDVIGTPTLNLRVKYEQAFADAKKAGTLVGQEFEKSNKRLESQQANVMRQMQANMDRLSGRKATEELNLLAQAVKEIGGVSTLSADGVKRLTADVNRLAAAGAKIPASLAGLKSGGLNLSSLGDAAKSLATGGGISGALGAIGPAGLAAAAGYTAVAGAVAVAAREVAGLASKAEGWNNTAQSTGLSVTTVQQLSDTFEDAGLGSFDLSKAMKALDAEVVGGGKNLAQFGVSIKGWDLMSQEERLQAIARVISQVEDPATKSAIAVAALGKSGMDFIPVADSVASGAYKMNEALGDQQVAALAKADEAIDRNIRKWENWKKKAVAAAVGFASDAAEAWAGLGDWLKTGSFEDKTVSPGKGKPKGTPKEEKDRQQREADVKAAEEKKKRAAAQKEVDAANAKALDSRIEREKAIQDAVTRGTKALLEEQLATDQAAQAAREHSGVLTKKAELELAAQQAATKGKALKSVFGKTELDNVVDPKLGLWTRNQDVVAQELENAAQKTKAVTKETVTWSQQLGNLGDQLQNLAATTGGLAGKLISFAGSIVSGIGGILNSVQTFKNGSKAGGLLGGLGKVAGAAGVVGSVIGTVGSIVSGIKGWFAGRQNKKDAAEASKILGSNVSVDQLKQFKEEAKQQGKDWRQYLKERKAADDRSRAVEARQKVEQGLGQAQQSAQSLLQRIQDGTVKSSAAIEQLFQRVNEQLMKNGLGVFDGRLQGSKEFQGAQGAANDVAGIIAGMRQAGVVDTGLLAAGGAAAGDLRQQATDAAKAAGMTDAEANKAGLAAIAPLLREQLNASLQSGKDLDDNTKKLLEEAKNNGIDILADPAIEAVDVAKEQLDVLKDIRGGGGGDAGNKVPMYHAAKGLRPAIMPNVGGGLGPLIQTHPNELALVVPAHMAKRGAFISAARGLGEEDPREDPRRRRDLGDPGGGAPTGAGPAGGGDAGAGAGGGSTTTTAEALDQMVAAVKGIIEAGPPKVTAQTTVNVVQDPMQSAETRDEHLRQIADHIGEQIRANVGPIADALNRKLVADRQAAR